MPDGVHTRTETGLTARNDGELMDDRQDSRVSTVRRAARRSLLEHTAGSLVVERIFNLPGLGKFFVISALQRDYTVVMGMVIVYAALILFLNLIADLTYSLLDPRTRQEA